MECISDQKANTPLNALFLYDSKINKRFIDQLLWRCPVNRSEIPDLFTEQRQSSWSMNHSDLFTEQRQSSWSMKNLLNNSRPVHRTTPKQLIYEPFVNFTVIQKGCVAFWSDIHFMHLWTGLELFQTCLQNNAKTLIHLDIREISALLFSVRVQLFSGDYLTSAWGWQLIWVKIIFSLRIILFNFIEFWTFSLYVVQKIGSCEFVCFPGMRECCTL